MAIQTDYPDRHSPAFAGMVADLRRANVLSRTVEVAALGFGRVAVQGAADRGVQAPDGDSVKFVGITVRDQAAAPGSPNEYRVGDTAGVLDQGPIWVTVAEAVAAGDAPTFANATGAIGKTTGAGYTAIPNARFGTSAAGGALALLSIG